MIIPYWTLPPNFLVRIRKQLSWINRDAVMGQIRIAMRMKFSDQFWMSNLNPSRSADVFPHH